MLNKAMKVALPGLCGASASRAGAKLISPGEKTPMGFVPHGLLPSWQVQPFPALREGRRCAHSSTSHRECRRVHSLHLTARGAPLGGAQARARKAECRACQPHPAAAGKDAGPAPGRPAAPRRRGGHFRRGGEGSGAAAAPGSCSPAGPRRPPPGAAVSSGVP